jgi:hypothetical protein
MTHYGNNKWYGEHGQTISKDDKERVVTICCKALVWNILEGKEWESKSRNSYCSGTINQLPHMCMHILQRVR